MSKSLPADRCNNCRFWFEDMTVRDPNDVNWGFGSCRREPPRWIEAIAERLIPKPSYGQITDSNMSPLELIDACRFPATFATDWCGQYHSTGRDVMP